METECILEPKQAYSDTRYLVRIMSKEEFRKFCNCDSEYMNTSRRNDWTKINPGMSRGRGYCYFVDDGEIQEKFTAIGGSGDVVVIMGLSPNFYIFNNSEYYGSGYLTINNELEREIRSFKEISSILPLTLEELRSCTVIHGMEREYI